MKTRSVYFLALTFGTLSIVFLLVGGKYASEIIPESVGLLTYLILFFGGAALCGYLQPDNPWRWGLVIAVVQPVIAVVILSVTGEFENPSNSTGGMVAFVLFIFIALIISPFSILASKLGAVIRKKLP
jgi:hypothetical protein